MSDPVTRWLETFMCHQYAPLLNAHGYDTLQSICQLHITQLVAMGIPLQHCHSIIENVSILRQTLSAEKFPHFDMNGRGMMNSCTQAPGGGPNGLYTNGMAPYTYDPNGTEQPQMSMPFTQYGGMMGGSGLASVDSAGYGHLFGGMSQQLQQQQQQQSMASSGYGSPFPVPAGDQMAMMSHYQNSGGHYVNGSSSYAHFPQQIAPSIRPVLQQNPQEIADSIYHMASSAYRAPAPAQLPPPQSARSAAAGQHPVLPQTPHQHTHMSAASMTPLGGGGNAGSGPVPGSYSPGQPYGRPTGMLSPAMGMTSSRAATGSSSSHPSPTTAGGAAGPMSPLSIRSPSAHGGGSHGQLSPGSVHSTSSPGLTPPPHVLSQGHLHRSSPGASHLMLHPHHGASSSSSAAPGGGGSIYGQGIARPQHLSASAAMAMGGRLHPQQLSSPGQMMGGGGSHQLGVDSAAAVTAAATGMFGSPLQSLARLAQISDKYPVDPKSIVSGGAAGLHDAMSSYHQQQQQQLHQQQLLHQHLQHQHQQQLPQSHLYAMYAGHSTGIAPYPASGYPSSSSVAGDYLKQEAADRPPRTAGPSQSKKVNSKAVATPTSASSSSSGSKPKAPGSKKGAAAERARKVSPMPQASDGGRGAQAGGSGSSSGSSAAAGGSQDALVPPQGDAQPSAAGSAAATDGGALQPAAAAAAATVTAAAAVSSQTGMREPALLSAALGHLPPPTQLLDRSRPPDAGNGVGTVVAAAGLAASPRSESVSGPVSGMINGSDVDPAGAAAVSLAGAAVMAGGQCQGGPEDLQERAQLQKSPSPLASSVCSPVLDVTTVYSGSSSSSSSSSADSGGSGFREDRCCAAGAETDGIPSLDACKAGSPFGEDGSETAVDRSSEAACAGDLTGTAVPADSVSGNTCSLQQRRRSGERGCEKAADGYNICSPARQQQQQQRTQLRELAGNVDDSSGSQHGQEACVSSERNVTTAMVVVAAAAEAHSAHVEAGAEATPPLSVHTAASAVTASAGQAAQLDGQVAAQRPAHPVPAGIDYSDSKNVPLRKRKQGLAVDTAAATPTRTEPQLPASAPPPLLSPPPKKHKTHAKKLQAAPTLQPPVGSAMATLSAPSGDVLRLPAVMSPPPAAATAETEARGGETEPPDLERAREEEREEQRSHGSRRWPSSAAPAVRSAPSAVAVGGQREASLPASAPKPVASPEARRPSLLLTSSDRRAAQTVPTAPSETCHHRPVPAAAALSTPPAAEPAAAAAAVATAAGAPSRGIHSPLPSPSLRALMAASPPAKQVPSSCVRQLEAGAEPVPAEHSGDCGDTPALAAVASPAVEAGVTAQQPEAVKRKRGRPLGSKNKKKDGLSYKPTKKDKTKQGATVKRSAAAVAAAAIAFQESTGRGSSRAACPSPPLSVLSAQLKSAAASSLLSTPKQVVASSLLSTPKQVVASSLLSTPKQVAAAAPKMEVPPTPEVHATGAGLAAAAGKASGDKPEVRVASFTKVGRVKEMSPRHAAATPSGVSARSLAADDSPWLCVFCHEVSNCKTLGDLFGPYRYVSSPCSPVSLSSASATVLSATAQPCLQWPPGTLESGKRGKQAARTSPATASVRNGGGSGGGYGSSAAAGESRPPADSGGCSRMVWYHEDCLVWAPGINLVGQQLVGLDEAIALGEQSFCTRCNRDGALLGCYCKGCSSRYHYLCAIDDGCTLTEENFSTICPRHNRGFTAVAGVSPAIALGQKGADAGHQSSDSTGTPKKKPRY